MSTRIRRLMALAIAGVTFGVVGTVLGVIALNQTTPGGAASGLTTHMVIPATGATLTGAQPLSADTMDKAPVTKVEFHVTGGKLTDVVIGSGILTFDGWLLRWDTRAVANGTYLVKSVAFDADGNSAYSAGVSVLVNN